MGAPPQGMSMGYSAPPMGAPPAGYGAPPQGMGYGAPPAGYGAPPQGMGPPQGYGAPPQGYGQMGYPPQGGAPPPGQQMMYEHATNDTRDTQDTRTHARTRHTHDARAHTHGARADSRHGRGYGGGGGFTQFQPSACTGRKKALLIGINYVNSQRPLKGCVNDVQNIRRFITQRFGFRDAPDSMV
jgi:hypothetical protein